MGKYFLAWQTGGCTGIRSDYYLIAQNFGQSIISLVADAITGFTEHNTADFPFLINDALGRQIEVDDHSLDLEG